MYFHPPVRSIISMDPGSPPALAMAKHSLWRHRRRQHRRRSDGTGGGLPAVHHCGDPSSCYRSKLTIRPNSHCSAPNTALAPGLARASRKGGCKRHRNLHRATNQRSKPVASPFVYHLHHAACWAPHGRPAAPCRLHIWRGGAHLQLGHRATSKTQLPCSRRSASQRQAPSTPLATPPHTTQRHAGPVLRLAGPDAIRRAGAAAATASAKARCGGCALQPAAGRRTASAGAIAAR